MWAIHHSTFTLMSSKRVCLLYRKISEYTLKLCRAANTVWKHNQNPDSDSRVLKIQQFAETHTHTPVVIHTGLSNIIKYYLPNIILSHQTLLVVTAVENIFSLNSGFDFHKVSDMNIFVNFNCCHYCFVLVVNRSTFEWIWTCSEYRRKSKYLLQNHNLYRNIHYHFIFD